MIRYLTVPLLLMFALGLGAVIGERSFAALGPMSAGTEVMLPEPIPCAPWDADLGGFCPYPVRFGIRSLAIGHDPVVWTDGYCLSWLPDYFGPPESILRWVPPSELFDSPGVGFHYPTTAGTGTRPVVPSRASGVGWAVELGRGDVCGRTFYLTKTLADAFAIVWLGDDAGPYVDSP